MEHILINYEDKCKIVLNSDCEVIDIECSLPIMGEGNNRIVYDLGDKVLKVAKSSIGSFYNRNEYNLWKYLKNKSKKIKINEIFEIDDNAYWYVAEKINTENPNAMNEAIKYISWLDYSNNAGYDKDGKLTIIDAEEVRVDDLQYLLEKAIIWNSTFIGR